MAVRVWTWSDEYNATAERNLPRYLNPPDENVHFRPLEDVTEMSIAEFTQTFSDPDTEVCLETPESIWKP